MKCPNRRYQVNENTQFCTKSIQVKSNIDANATLYIEHGSRLVIEYDAPVECYTGGIGDIFEAETPHGEKKYISQEDKVREFREEVVPMNHTGLIYVTIQRNSLNYNSFDKSGLYDESFLKMRNDYIYNGNIYSQMQQKITHTFFHDSRNWREERSETVDFLSYIGYEDLVNTVFGWTRDFTTFMTVVSWCANCYFLFIVMKSIKSFGVKKLGICKRNNSVVVVANVGRGQVQMRGIEEDWFDALSDNPPPAYASI